MCQVLRCDPTPHFDDALMPSIVSTSFRFKTMFGTRAGNPSAGLACAGSPFLRLCPLRIIVAPFLAAGEQVKRLYQGFFGFRRYRISKAAAANPSSEVVEGSGTSMGWNEKPFWIPVCPPNRFRAGSAPPPATPVPILDRPTAAGWFAPKERLGFNHDGLYVSPPSTLQPNTTKSRCVPAAQPAAAAPDPPLIIPGVSVFVA